MTPKMTIEYIDDFASRLAQFILTDDEKELIPELQEFTQMAVDQLRDDDLEAIFARIDHHLSYPDENQDGRFVFKFEVDPTGQSDEPYTFALTIGRDRSPYVIVATGRK